MRASPFMLIQEAEFSRLAFPPEKFFLHIKRGHSQKGNDQHTYLKTTSQAGVKELHNFCFDSKNNVTRGMCRRRYSMFKKVEIHSTIYGLGLHWWITFYPIDL